jgi:hypothetical protein
MTLQDEIKEIFLNALHLHHSIVLIAELLPFPVAELDHDEEKDEND